MGIDVEINGEVLAEAVVADQIAQGGGAHGAAHRHSCANCGADLLGEYCHRCGQTAHLHHSLLHMLEELLHGLFHFETRAWRTIPALVLRPGQLTRAYIAGQRTRYVSPLALLLFLIFLMFLVFSLTGDHAPAQQSSTAVVSKPAQANQAKEAALAAIRARLATLENKLARLAPNDKSRADAEEEIAQTKIGIRALEISTQQPQDNDADSAHDKGMKLTQLLRQSFQESKTFAGYPWLEQRILHAAENPELTVYKMKSAAAKFAFLLMPISLPFLWLLFAFRRQFTMFDHAVFSLYSLSFMSLLMIALALLGQAGLGMLATLACVIVPPLHMYSQLRNAYQLTSGASIWRTAALLLVALCSLLIYMLLVAGLSL